MASRTPFGARDVAIAGSIASFGLVLRVLHWSHERLMFNDGPRFLVQAQHFAAGRWEEALADPYHPLYAMAVATVRLALGGDGGSPADWERAAVVVSIAAGSLGILVFYAFAKSAFGFTAAWIGALLLACNPYALEYSANVQSEGLFLLCFLGAVAFGWSALKQASPSLAGWAGGAAAMAYLTRPEGLGVAVATGLCGLGLWLRGRWPTARAVPWGLALVAGLLAGTAPYLVWLRVEQGHWSVSQKKSVAALAGTTDDEEARPSLGYGAGSEIPFDEDVRRLRYTWRARSQEAREDAIERGLAEPEPAWKRQLGAVGNLLHTFESALRPEIVLLAVLGIGLCLGRPGLRGQYIITVLLLYGLLLWGLVVNYGYLSRRHALAPGMVLMGYAGLAVPRIGSWLGAGIARLRGGRAPRPALATALAVALVAGVGLSKVFRPHTVTNHLERDAGEWIEAHGSPQGPVAAGKRRVAYYAGAPWFPLRKIPQEAPLAKALRMSGVRYVVADPGDVAAYRDLAEPERAGLRIVHSIEEDGQAAFVFEVVSQGGG